MQNSSWLTLLLLLTFAGPASAQRVDTVVLANGDRITCEVLTLTRGQLQVKTDDAGTLSLNWDKVVSITSPEQYDVGTRDGRRFFGSLDAASAGRLAVIGPGGTDRTTLTFDEVVSIARIRASFFRRIDGNLDLGGSYTQSSGVAQFSFDSEATYRRPSFAVNARLSSSLTRQADEPDSERVIAEFGYARFRRLWQVSPLALIERNPDLGFETRYTGALTVGRYLKQTNRSLVLLAGGAALGREKPVDQDPVTNVDALVVFEASTFSYHYPKTAVDLAIQVFPGLSDLGRIRMNTTVKLRRELIRNLSVAFGGYDSYDNQPEAEGARTNDTGFSLSLGVTF